ncbi:MAG TPA: hypothetical protein PK491_06685, partial [Candidatus Hydrogenedentes bacterium]|nr:hypothetical protein [Candidatus Hydrogenedentota bacterium]
AERFTRSAASFIRHPMVFRFKAMRSFIDVTLSLSLSASFRGSGALPTLQRQRKQSFFCINGQKNCNS